MATGCPRMGACAHSSRTARNKPERGFMHRRSLFWVAQPRLEILSALGRTKAMHAIAHPARLHWAAQRRAGVITAIKEHVDDGPAEITVSVTAREVGRDLDIGFSRLYSEIEAAGFWIVRSSNPGPSHPGEIVVRRARKDADRRKSHRGPDRRISSTPTKPTPSDRPETGVRSTARP
jgi:hypothetical protein